MRKAVPLHDDWKLGWTCFSGEVALPPDRVEEICRFPASVPGVAQMDLMRAGVLPDLFVGANADHALWMESKDWWYRLAFATPDSLAEKHASLVFHGLDTFATVWLNGHQLGQTENMFLRHTFDVTKALRVAGSNELLVRLAAPQYSVNMRQDHEYGSHSPERLFCRKAQMSYGWDIAPRILTTGIWRPVELVMVDHAWLTNVWIRPRSLERARRVLDVEIEVEWLAAGEGDTQVDVAIHDGSWRFEEACHPGINTFHYAVELADPPLWWPIGYGDADLVEAKVDLAVAGQTIDSWEQPVGLAHIGLVQEPQPSGATSFCFRCNDKDVFVTGLNWTPLDALFPRVSDSRVTQVLEDLAGIGCNMLRVWGGGVYETQHFYSECDRLGIMVWQDFMMGGGWYPQDDDFASRLEAEAHQVIRDLRSHVCLSLWCGDNEVDMFYGSEKAAGNRLTRQVLPEACRQLDPDRAYVPSSPSSRFEPSQEAPAFVDNGDTHCWHHGHDYRDPVFWDLRCRFLSEFGHLSLPSMEVIEKYFPAGTAWPLTGAMWRYHGTDTTYLLYTRGPERILEALSACGRPAPDSLEQAIEASQELQADAICAWIQHYAEDPEFGGFLIWNVGDCWPQQSDSIMDYLGHHKRVFARFGPLFAQLREDREKCLSQHVCDGIH